MEGDFMFGGMEPKRIMTRELKIKLQKSTATSVVTKRLLHYIASLIGFDSLYSYLLTISRYRVFLFLFD